MRMRIGAGTHGDSHGSQYEYGAWSMEYEGTVCSLQYGVWSMEYGVSSMEYSDKDLLLGLVVSVRQGP